MCVAVDQVVVVVVGHGGVEGRLPGHGAHPARRPLPRPVPPLALPRRPPQPAQLHRRHQRRRAPHLGLLHDEGNIYFLLLVVVHGASCN